MKVGSEKGEKKHNFWYYEKEHTLFQAFLDDPSVVTLDSFNNNHNKPYKNYYEKTYEIKREYVHIGARQEPVNKIN